MIVVSIQLASAITHKLTDLGCVLIVNDGTGTHSQGNYDVETRKKNARHVVVRKGRVEKHARNAEPVYSLLKKALEAMGY